MKQISATELAGLRASGADLDILDVREPWEVALTSLPDCLHVPMGEITARFSELAQERTIVCLCHHGARSMQVAFFLEQQGFTTVYNLQGGIDAWSKQVDPQCPTY